MFRPRLQSVVARCVESLVSAGELPKVASDVKVEIDVTRQAAHGDFATNWAMVGAKTLGGNPRQAADKLAASLLASGQFSAVEVAGPGFINLTLSPALVADVLGGLLDQGESMAQADSRSGQRINVEFVSVNPNGPITIGSGRGAAYGSALCNVLEAAGNLVHREYYVNDGVNSEQMRRFAVSIRSFIATMAYGEWKDKPSTNFLEHGLLDLTHLFAAEKGDTIRDDGADLYAEWVQFARLHQQDDGNVGVLARLAIENHTLHGGDYYKEHRQRQLSAYLGAYRANPGSTSAELTRIEFGYPGDYVLDVAHKLVDAQDDGPDKLERWEPAVWDDGVLERLLLECETKMVEAQKSNLSAFGVHFDTWFSEQSLHDSGAVARDVATLEVNGAADRAPMRTVVKSSKGGVVTEVRREQQDAVSEGGEEEGEGETPTLWLRSTKFDDDMDRVLQRRDGRWTYIASDVSYHKDKFNRPAEADRLITVLGPDHHGYIGRLRAVLAALFMADGRVRPEPGAAGLSESEAVLYSGQEERDVCRAATALAADKLQVQIFQVVRFLKDGKPAPMRKRDGNIYALIDLIDEIGKAAKPNGTLDEQRQVGSDVARFFYLMRHHDTAMDFDLDLAARQSDDNPVYYVQYAHARVCSVLDRAAEAGFLPPPSRGEAPSGREGEGVPGPLLLLTHPAEKALAIKAADLEHEIRLASEDYGVNRLTTYAVELARTYHSFYDQCRVIQPDQPELTCARVGLCLAARNSLRSVFRILGVSAPDRMSRD